MARFPLPPDIPREDKEAAYRRLRLPVFDRRFGFFQNLFFWWGGWMATVVGKLMHASCRLQEMEIHPDSARLFEDPRANFILAIWHNRGFYASYTIRRHVARKGHDLLAIMSLSRDAEIIARATQNWGAFVVRGSSSRGGTRALLHIIRHARLNFAPMVAPDGPRGPRYQVKEGLPIMARLCKLPVIPFCYDADKKWMAKSWDRFMIPRPFTKVVAGFGAPIYVGRNDDLGEASQRIAAAMNEQCANMAAAIERLA